MIFSLDVRRAEKGDCLLLHFGSKNQPGLIMIDGGPSGVYGPHLKPRLEKIRQSRGLGDNMPLEVRLLMVSHVDDDHIQGILDLTKEMRDAQLNARPKLVQVLSFWHNSFDEIIDHKPDELTASVESQFGPASLSGSGELPEDKKSEVEDQYAEDNPQQDPDEQRELVSSSLMVLASIAQGHQLRVDAQGLGFPRNPEFGEKLILADQGQRPVDIGQGLKFTVVGPTKKELEALRKKHNEWLKKLKKEGKTPPQALAAYVDESVPNLSSIVVLAEANGKKMLLTGDARGDKILKGLQLVELLGAGTTSTMHVDLLKVPHHGSANNLDNDFFERISADHYVFSGNGEHGNPEREALEMLFRARGDKPFVMHFTYPIAEIDVGREADWKIEQNKEKKKKAKKPTQKVRKDWSPPEHSLTAFLAGKNLAAKGQKIEIVNDPAPHVIDLLDPVGF